MTFSVDPALIGHTVSTIRQLSSELQQQTIPSGALGGVCGRSTVESGMHDLVHHWGQGMEKIQGDLETLADRLSQSGICYADTESNITSASGASK